MISALYMTVVFQSIQLGIVCKVQLVSKFQILLNDFINVMMTCTEIFPVCVKGALTFIKSYDIQIYNEFNNESL